jgi:Leucine-rich repeat (LRR) protein
MTEIDWYNTYFPDQQVISDTTNVSLSRLNLTFIPDSLFEKMVHVHVLDLSFNNLTTIPDTIDKCVSLRELWLNDNQLTSLPESVKNLNLLIRLDVHNNKLTHLPAEFDTHVMLILDASYNEIEELNETTFTNMSSLCILKLDHNKLTTIPHSVCHLPSLQVLDLVENNITECIQSKLNRDLNELWV